MAKEVKELFFAKMCKCYHFLFPTRQDLMRYMLAFKEMTIFHHFRVSKILIFNLLYISIVFWLLYYDKAFYVRSFYPKINSSHSISRRRKIRGHSMRQACLITTRSHRLAAHHLAQKQ